MSKIKLGVNIDHIAFIKKSRDTKYPDLREAVSICESSGADSITIHLREDRRHIQDQDAILIRKNAKKLNFEMETYLHLRFLCFQALHKRQSYVSTHQNLAKVFRC